MTKKIFKLWCEARTLRREVKDLHKSLSNAERINKCLLSSSNTSFYQLLQETKKEEK